MAENVSVDYLKQFKVEISKFIMPYKFAVDEINTKINILKEEFTHLHEYNPIEQVSSRVKTVESILKKVNRRQIDLSLDVIREEIKDIAGVRVTCAFTSDIYNIKEMIEKQKDIKVLEVKDYFKHPKPNGYRSLHLLIEIPIFLSESVEYIPVEIQIRTIAMDFWASLEHKIFYKYNKGVPQTLLNELKEAATAATELDAKMERLNKEINMYKQKDIDEGDFIQVDLENEQLELPLQLLESLIERNKKQLQ
ncbi:MAG TPA: GTP pyrophosphokinase family protein [Virgibacillus sp.]|nr:GTP pyrophosphokinase family protein [Virgibacillus sp.]